MQLASDHFAKYTEAYVMKMHGKYTEEIRVFKKSFFLTIAL